MWEMQYSNLFKVLKVGFNDSSKGIQYQHVYDQMHPIGMNKPMGEQSVVLFSVMHLVRIEHQFRKHCIVVKSKNRGEGGNDDDDQCHFLN